jgi:hypothetical protein
MDELPLFSVFRAETQLRVFAARGSHHGLLGDGRGREQTARV